MNFLEKWFGYVMTGCYWLTHNYVISLLLFALIFQLVLFPLGWKQQKNMVKQAMLRPQEMAIKKKYAGRNDQVTMRKMQNELMELQQNNGYSPLAGCLPMIVQMIIIFPLYWVVVRPLQYAGRLSYSACYAMAEALKVQTDANGNVISGIIEFGKNGQPTSSAFQVDIATQLANGWRPDASLWDPERNMSVLEEVNGMIDRFNGVPNATLFGVDLGVDPFSALGMRGSWWLIIIPLINLGLMYLSQYLSKKLNYQSVQQETQQAAGSMKIMMYVLPLMTFFATATFATAIGIYWIFRTLLSMLQQFILYKALPYPKFTEEDYKKAEKEYKKGTVSTGTRNIPQREYRSLHHIDDDD